MILTDNELIEEILLGTKDSFEVLLRRNNQLLYRTIGCILKEDQEIQDAMQETYIKIFLNISTFKGTAKFSTWLIRIGINEALHIKNKTSKFQTLSINNKSLEDVIENKIISKNTSDKIIIQSELKAILENVINQLSPEYRVIFILKEIEGMSNKEIALSLEISSNNVKVKLHRAKKILKTKLLKTWSLSSLFEFGNEKCDALVQSFKFCSSL